MFEIHDICKYLMLSYVKSMIKSSVGFAHSVMCDAYKLMLPHRKPIEIRKNAVRFVGVLTFKFEFAFKTFSKKDVRALPCATNGKGVAVCSKPPLP